MMENRRVESISQSVQGLVSAEAQEEDPSSIL